MPIDGPVTVTNVATSAIVANGTLGLEFDLPAMAIGSHPFLVSYGGSSDYAPSSKTFNVIVTSDVVQATGVGLDATTFYPVVDGYRDVVKARGTRLEPASVRATFYSPGGSPIRALTVGTGTGPYALSWNGKSSSGVLQPAGKYKVIQVLTDAAGTKRSFTSYVYLSRKRLYSYTTYVNVTTPTKRTTSWFGYQYALPSATVYKSLTFQVYGRSINVPGIEIGGWDFRVCSLATTWSPGCVSTWAGVGFSTNWYSKALSPTYNRYGRTVRAFAATSYGSVRSPSLVCGSCTPCSSRFRARSDPARSNLSG